MLRAPTPILNLVGKLLYSLVMLLGFVIARRHFPLIPWAKWICSISENKTTHAKN